MRSFKIVKNLWLVWFGGNRNIRAQWKSALTACSCFEKLKNGRNQIWFKAKYRSFHARRAKTKFIKFVLSTSFWWKIRSFPKIFDLIRKNISETSPK